MSTLVHIHCFVFNPEANSGESLTLTTSYYEDGPKKLVSSQQLALGSYCNSASFDLMGAQLTPENLRKLADELEAAEKKATEEVWERL